MAKKSPWPFLVANSKLPGLEKAIDSVARLSESGAVLGRPDLEHGAYGMVKGRASAQMPSIEERNVRGLGPNTLPINKQ